MIFYYKGVIMTRIISICSGKGGAGKTTVTANLGSMLSDMGYDVTVIDGNLTTPNLGLHLGVPLYPTTLHDVLKGKDHIRNATYRNDRGLKVIPSGLSIHDMRGVDSRNLPDSLLDLLGTTDIILIDTAAGLGRECLSSLEAADELLLVVHPEITSITDALKAAKLAEQVGTKILGVVVNRVSGQKHEMTRREIASMLEGYDIIGEIPEDINVRIGVSSRYPVVHGNPKSHASREIGRIAYNLTGREYKYPHTIREAIGNIFNPKPKLRD